MTSRSDAGTGDAEQSVSKTQEQTPSLVSQLLAEAAEDGHIIGPPKLSNETESSETEETEAKTAEETETEETETEAETAEEETQETEETEDQEKEQVAPEKKSIDDQLKEFTAKGEKPPWYLPRIADETRKRHKANEERDKAVTLSRQLSDENQRLHSQLNAPRPNGADPLADIFDEAGLQRIEKVYNDVIRLAELNPEGVYDYTIKRSDGTEEKKDFSREELVDMKLEAQSGLRTLIPQRRNYLQARSQIETQARKVYPELADEQSGWVQIGQQFLANIPELQRTPDIWLWIARAIRGYQVEQAQLKNKTPAKKIITASRQTKAPVPPTARGGFVPRTKAADLDKAREELKTKGDHDAAERYLESLGVGGGPKSKRTVLVG